MRIVKKYVFSYYRKKVCIFKKNEIIIYRSARNII